MSTDRLIMQLCEDNCTDPAIEVRSSLEYLCNIRDQLEKTKLWGKQCVVLEFEFQSPLGGRVLNHLNDRVEYETIAIAEIGASRRPRSDRYSIQESLYIQTDRSHLCEIAALYEEDRGTGSTSNNGSHKWVTEVPPSSAESFIDQVNQLEEQITNPN